MDIDKGDLRSLVSIGRGMWVYLDIEQVDSKGSPIRLFLCTMNMKCIMPMIYDVDLIWCLLCWGTWCWSLLLYFGYVDVQTT